MYSSNLVSFSAVKRRERLLDHPLPSKVEEVNEQRNIPSSGLYDRLQAKRYLLLNSIIPPVLCIHTNLPTTDPIASVRI